MKNKIEFGGEKKSILDSFKRALFYVPWQFRPKFYWHLFNLIFSTGSRKKRILGIWDYKSLPWSVGDPLVFVEMLNILKIRNNAEEVDICVVYDRENPWGNRGDNKISKSNAMERMLDYLPLFSTCQFLGSTFQFNSRAEFLNFLTNNIWRYDIYPPLYDHLSEKYNHVGGAPDIIDIKKFYNENGYIPFLKISEDMKRWADRFYIDHLPKGAFPVALTLRGTEKSVERNANQEVWLKFIDICKVSYPEITFVIAGLKEEMFDELKNRSNVIVLKDFGTSIIEDLALIRGSLLYMGTASGPAIIALFSDLPYLIFQIPIESLGRYGMKTADEYPYFKNKQKYFSTQTPVTVDLLLSEFEVLYSKLDRENWLKNLTQSCISL